MAGLQFEFSTETLILVCAVACRHVCIAPVRCIFCWRRYYWIPLRGAYAGASYMSAFVQRPVPLRVPRLRRPLMPHWLTHLGALGLFSVSVVDSSVIPLPLPGSTDLLLLWLVAHSGRSLAAGPLCHCRQHPGRIHHLAHWPQRRRSGAAQLCAGASSWASRQVGGASSGPGGLSSRLASSAHSAIAVCARLRCAGRLAQALPCRLRRGSQPALLLHRVARRGLWTPDRPPVVWNSPEVVNSAALLVRGSAGCWRLFWNMEDSRAASDRGRWPVDGCVGHCVPPPRGGGSVKYSKNAS